MHFLGYDHWTLRDLLIRETIIITMSAMIETNVIEPNACVIEEEDDMVFDMETLGECWEDIGHHSFAAEACFFNCQNDSYKKTVIQYLDEVESATEDYTQCIFDGLEHAKFVEKSQPIPPLPPGTFCNNSEHDEMRSHPIYHVTHKDIVAQIEQYEESRNTADFIGLKHKVEVMKECVRVYVESNRTNTDVYVTNEKDPAYSDLPAWMFFPFQK